METLSAKTMMSAMKQGFKAGAILICASLSVNIISAPMTVAIAQTKITAGIVGHSPNQLAEYWTMDYGCAKEKGFTLDLVTVGGRVAQQLAAGALNIGQSGFPDTFRAIAQAAPMKIFINNHNVPPYSVHAKSSIKSIAELKGKTVSIGAVKDVTLIYMEAFLEAGGLKSSDVDFVYAKSTADRFKALVAGGIDATILNPPASFRADGLGFTNLGDIGDHMKDYPFTVWTLNSNWAADNRGALTAFAKCHLLGNEWIYNTANKDKAVALIVKYTKAAPADAEKTYNYMAVKLKAYSRTGQLSEKVFEHMKKGLIQLGDLKEPVAPLSTFFDPSYVSGGN